MPTRGVLRAVATKGTEWQRILMPGGLFCITFTDHPPSESDPTGDMSLEDIRQLFPGEMNYYRLRHPVSGSCDPKTGQVIVPTSLTSLKGPFVRVETCSFARPPGSSHSGGKRLTL